MNNASVTASPPKPANLPDQQAGLPAVLSRAQPREASAEASVNNASVAAPPPKPANRRALKAALAGGAGSLVALLFFLLEQRPELAQLLLERVVIAWGPLFVIVLLLFAFFYLLVDRYAPRLISAQSQTALALQDLARSVEQLATRDDSFRREQDVLLNHVARRVDALHRLLEAHQRTLNGHLARLARRHGAARGLSRRRPRQANGSRKPTPTRQGESAPQGGEVAATRYT